MKKKKNVFALLIAMILVLSLSTSALAATIVVETGTNASDGSISQDVLSGETYNAYKILNYTSADTDGNGIPDAYSYYLTAEQYAADNTDGLGKLLESAGFHFTASSDGTQYVLDNAAAITDAADVANDLYAIKDKIASVAIASATATATADKQAVFSNLDTGYWFVTSSLGSLCTLQSYDDEALIVEKNTMVTDSKTVDESNESLQVGDTATYTITLTDGKGTNLAATLTDTMSAGLTYNNDATVTANGTALVKDTDYTVTVTGGNGSQTVVVYTFTAAVMTALEENQHIVVTYTATLNQYASLDGTETNTEVTSYSTQNTSGNTVEVKDYNLTIQKKAKSEDGDSLKGAQFALYRDNETTALNVVSITVDTPAADTVYYRVAAAGETGATTVIDMTEAYDAVIYGLDGDSTYHIEETTAPDGYNKLAGKVPVQMGDANKVQPVVNNAGSILPSTGGIGTTIFYIIGAVLVIGAGVVIVTKRRMNDD